MLEQYKRSREVAAFIQRALEASVYVSPRDHWLTAPELVEIGSRHSFREGEIIDTLHSSDQLEFYLGERVRPGGAQAMFLVDFNSPWDGDPRNPRAYQYVLDSFEELAREAGSAQARLQRDVLVARGESAGYVREEVEVAIGSYVSYGLLQESRDGVLSRSRNRSYASPKTQLEARQQAGGSSRSSRPNPVSASLLRTVEDVIARRSDGRPKYAEPLKAFGELLATKRNAQYRLWWDQTCGELRRADAVQMPTAALVLAAALTEGALALIALDVRATGESMMGKVFDQDPKNWKLTDLAGEARKGTRAIFSDPTLTDRCHQLNANRQRIHAGRFLSLKVLAPQVDIRPEEARYAKETLDQVVRSILDWFDASP